MNILKRLQKFSDYCYDVDVDNAGFAMSMLIKDKANKEKSLTNQTSLIKAYLQDLFDHMSNEHGLTLTQSEMLEIISICDKEYDTVQFELGEIERQNRMMDTDTAQLREALRELVEDIEESKIDWKLGHTLMYRTLITPSVLDQAKQLLTTNTNDDEKD